MLPQKLFFRIGEVAGLVGVEPHVLRYWEREFRSIRPTKSAKGQRVYSRKDVENLLRVRDLLYRDGFTIAGAKKKLQRGHAEEEHEPAAETERAPLDVPRPPVQVVLHTNVALESARAGEHAVEAAPASSAVSAVSAVSALHEVAVPAPAPAPAEQMREKLLALRSEVEAFLAELSPTPQR